MILNGKGAAPGIAVGRVFVYTKIGFLPQESFVPEGEEQSHLDRYLAVKKEAFGELEGLKLSMQKHDPQKADIFTAHQEIIEDIVINEEIPSRILNEKWAGDWAIYQVYETVLLVLQKAADPLIAERAADFDNVRALLLRLWYGNKNEGLSSLTEPVIIAAQDLLPSDTASLDRSKALALLTEKGGLTSHTAIIARSYGIPTVMGVHGLLDAVKQGQLAVVNADEGEVILDPENEVAAEYRKKYELFSRDRQDAQTYLSKQAITADGEKIDIGLNISAVTDDELAASANVDSVGLFRTEFLYIGRDTLPDEEEQISAYKKVLERFGECPVILRTLDIGGDKQLSCMDLPREENPFLGNRALRFCFSNPDIFKTQIRAALRASVYGNMWLMFPMVNSIDDIRRAKEIIASVKEELEKEGKPFGQFKTGIMIEIPSIALLADFAAQEVDFASIGSNDLCQYLCAADRMNIEVEPYYQSYHPAMFTLIKKITAVFEKNGKPVSICGELASDPLAIPALVGLGLRKLSMGTASVAAAKRALCSLTVKQSQEIAQKVLECSTAEEVKRILGTINS
ncbi:MAG: phosphoenolpyruvate--protein phosphotransferase [Treponema sp.]|jgi:phosphotransferase system enzyme I (PtsI)|nr:phosphoenolpyruvate--protein phosphotransferase [Treponema sp.]